MLSFYILGAKKIFSILKKIFFIFTVYFVIIFLFINFTSNNSIKTERNFEKKINKYDDKILKDEKLTNNPYGKIYIQIYKGSNCFLFGQLCDNNNLDEQNYKNSFFGKFNTLFESLYLNQPASFSFWASNSLNKAGFIPNVFALDNSRQATTGIGFQSLKSFYILWENFRNLSFLIITLVLVTIGFMIMFRTKINPQTVISIENALPKIIISMILITFSYPIAGLMIDLMYVSLPIVAGLFKNILYMPPDDLAKSIDLAPIIPSKTPADIVLKNIIFELINNAIKLMNPFGNRSILDLTFDQFINDNAFAIVFDWLNFNLYIKAINDIISGAFLSQNIIFQESFKIIISVIGLFLISALINPVGEYLSSILGNLGEGAGIGIPRLIFFGFVTMILVNFGIILIAFLGLFFLAFRIFFFLLSCFFNLIIYIILAPLLLLLEAIPGKNSFSSWIKNIAGNLIVFPVFLFIILLQKSFYVFLSQDSSFISLPGLNFYLFGVKFEPINIQTSIPFFISLINIYIILMIPDLLKTAKALVIGKEGISIPTNAGIMLGGIGAATGSIMGFANQFYYLKTGYEALLQKKSIPARETGQQEPEKEKNIFRNTFNEGIKWVSKKFGF